MGLDIYFYKTQYKGDDHREALSQRGTEFAYFRKANFIYGYAEDNGLLDESESIAIFTKSDAEDFVCKCREVTDNNELAPELLPTRCGFFFGSQDYYNSYFTWIERVLKDVAPVVERMKDDEKIVVYFWY